MNTRSLLLVGAGPMAMDYSKVLNALDCKYEGLTRRADSAAKFTASTGRLALSGGAESLPKNRFCRAIVAVDIESLAAVASSLIRAGVREILLEKPGALSREELTGISALAQSCGAKVFVAYNRRFYASVIALKERLKMESIQSLHFEFTEWSHRIGPMEMPERIKSNWLLANSSHVIDLAFHLAGRPVEMTCRTKGDLSWHPPGAVFSGAGTTSKGALFSYHANWLSAGRWGVEILTGENRYILRPLEELQVQKRGAIMAEPVKINDQLDRDFKAGLMRQVECFLDGSTGEMLTLAEQIVSFKTIYEPILAGSS